MIDADNIAHAAAAFIAADAAYAAHEAITREQTLDLAIAERSNDADAIHDAQVARKAHHVAWHPLYVARQDAADAVARAVGLDPSKLSAAFRRY